MQVIKPEGPAIKTDLGHAMSAAGILIVAGGLSLTLFFLLAK
ncbi:MAG: hypothetical protein ACLPYZ_03260 [Limisphaerales bacterium]